MNLLLDTHTLLWYADGSTRLSARAKALLDDPTNSLHLSMATLWEVAIKTGIGKLTLSSPYGTYMRSAISLFRLSVIPITLEDCESYSTLPFPSQTHRDPFDRLIIAHAMRHSLTIVANDPEFDSYGINQIW